MAIVLPPCVKAIKGINGLNGKGGRVCLLPFYSHHQFNNIRNSSVNYSLKIAILAE